MTDTSVPSSVVVAGDGYEFTVPSGWTPERVDTTGNCLERWVVHSGSALYATAALYQRPVDDPLAADHVLGASLRGYEIDATVDLSMQVRVGIPGAVDGLAAGYVVTPFEGTATEVVASVAALGAGRVVMLEVRRPLGLDDADVVAVAERVAASVRGVSAP